VTEPQCATRSEVLTSAQAAKALLVTRARLAELVWTGELQQSDDGGFTADEVSALARRFAMADNEKKTLPQMRWTRHRALWLLHDWGGGGRPADLSRTLHIELTSLAHTLRDMGREGYLARTDDGWQLTERGWDYCARTDSPPM